MKKAILTLSIVGVLLAGMIIILSYAAPSDGEDSKEYAEYSYTALKIADIAATDIFGGNLYRVTNTYWEEKNCWVVVLKDINVSDLDHTYFVFVDVGSGAVLSAVKASEVKNEQKYEE